MKYIDTSGHDFDYENNDYIAEQLISPELTVIYQQNERDIELFLRAISGDSEITNIESEKAELLKSRCTRRNNRCQGSCSSGSCRAYSSGNFSGCKCY